MLEHLDDPSPPQSTARALAAVFARSAALRRRRSLAIFGVVGLCILIAGVGIGELVPRSPGGLAVTDLASHAGALATGLPVAASDLVGAVFPDDTDGFALTAGTGQTALVGTTDGGANWTVIQGDMPVGSTAQLDFVSPTDGYLWGGPPARDGTLPLWTTNDGGRQWVKAPIGPVVADVSAIGDDVWAVTGTCPVTSTNDAPGCPVTLEVSLDGGATWAPSASPPPLSEPGEPSFNDQNMELARMTRSHAYVLTFDPVGEDPTLSRLVYTGDAGASWSVLPDPCSGTYSYGEIAGSGSDDLWLVCSSQAFSGTQAKALYRSHDGGLTWAVFALSPSLPAVSGGSAELTGVGSLTSRGLVAPFSLGHDNLAVISATDAWLFPEGADLYQTTDGGRVWKAVAGLSGFSPVAASGNVVFADATHGWVDEPGVGIWRTTDATIWHRLGS